MNAIFVPNELKVVFGAPPSIQPCCNIGHGFEVFFAAGVGAFVAHTCARQAPVSLGGQLLP